MTASLNQTGDMLRRSQGLISQAVGRGTGILADRIEHYTNVAGDVGDVLRDKGEPAAAEMVETLADRVRDIAQYLRTHDGGDLWMDAQEFARSRTWLLAGVGLVGGMAAARAIRTAGEYASNAYDSSEYADTYSRPDYGEASYNPSVYAESYRETSYVPSPSYGRDE